MPTMSHTPEQRKDWHDGKRKSGESVSTWFRRVFQGRSKNIRGAATPRRLKKGIFYQPI